MNSYEKIGEIRDHELNNEQQWKMIRKSRRKYRLKAVSIVPSVGQPDLPKRSNRIVAIISGDLVCRPINLHDAGEEDGGRQPHDRRVLLAGKSVGTM